MAQDISFDPKKYAQELAEQSKKVLPTGKTLEAFQHDVDAAMRPGISISYETELRMLKKVLGVLETVAQQGVEWSGVKDSFNNQSFTPEEKEKAAQMIEQYTRPGTAAYLTQDGLIPARSPQLGAPKDFHQQYLLEQGAALLTPEQNKQWQEHVADHFDDLSYRLSQGRRGDNELEMLQAINQNSSWEEVKKVFEAQRHSGGSAAEVSRLLEELTQIPGLENYLRNKGPEPTQAPHLTPPTPELTPMQTLDKLMDTLSHEFLDAAKQTQADTRDGSRKEQRAAMDHTIEECSQKFGISQDNLRAVVAYLRMDPSANGPGYQKEAEKRLNVVLDAMKEHTPKGEIDKATLDAWKQKVAEASKTLKDLQDQWNELSAAKEVCEQQRRGCMDAVAAQKKELAACDQKITELETIIEQKKAEFSQTFKDTNIATLQDPNSPAAQAWAELTKLGQDLASHKQDQEQAKTTLSALEADLKTARDELSQTEFDLKQKTFDVRAAMMVCSLQEQMKDAIEHMPLLDEKTQEAQEIVEDVKDLRRDYEDLAQQYKGVRIELGEKLQQSPHRLLQEIGDALIDWKIKDIQKANEWETSNKMFKMDISTRWDKFKLEVGGIFNKSSNAYIDLHTKKAMKELSKINKLDARIEKQTKRAEQQAMRQIRREHQGQRMTKAEIEQTPEYKARVKELVGDRTAKTKEKREKHIDKYQKHATKVKEAAQHRKEVFEKHRDQRKELGHRIDVMREFGDIGEKAHFSFSQDLKSLLPENAMVNKIVEKSKEFDAERDRDEGRDR